MKGGILSTTMIVTNTINSFNKTSELLVLIKPNGCFELKWNKIKKELTNNQILIQNQFYKYYDESIYDSLFFLGLSNEKISLHESLDYLRIIVKKLLNNLLSYAPNPCMENTYKNIDSDIDFLEIIELTKIMPNLDGCEYLNVKWIKTLWSNLQVHLNKSLLCFNGNIDEYFSSLNKNLETPNKIYFHLTANKETSDIFPFTFTITYDKCIHSISDSSSHHSGEFPIKNIFNEFKNNTESIDIFLCPLHKAAMESVFLNRLVHSNAIFDTINLSADDAFIFINEIALYEKFGISCTISDFYDDLSGSLSMIFNINNIDHIKHPDTAHTENLNNDKSFDNINKINQISSLNINSIIDFDASLVLGDKIINEEEINNILSEKEGLKFINDRWIKISHYELENLLHIYSDIKNFTGSNNMTFIETLKFKMNMEKKLKSINNSYIIKMNVDDYLTSIVKKLNLTKNHCPIIDNPDFQINLRPYQKDAVNWLYMMKNMELGACLADDMGLGKTLEVLALLTYVKFNTPIEKRKASEKTLLILPASLIENWKSEISKFTPWLKYYIIHPSQNKNIFSDDTIVHTHENIEKPCDDNVFTDYDLIITTYGMISKYDFFKNVFWDSLILDEAQAIKNPSTKQTKSVKELNSKFRIAMTGTPIENHLSDLWSIFDFLNKNLLGSQNDFSTYINYLKSNDTNYESLRKFISPFIMRRVKTDKSIISDLPEKIEIKTYAILSNKQIILYNNVLKDFKNKLLDSDKDTSYRKNIYRSGLILSTIIKLKQICNHPDHYLKKTDFAYDYSGKYTLLRKLCETIFENKERVLIFTQFKEMTTPLKTFLEDTFNNEGIVLNGDIPIKKRKILIDKFQDKKNYVPFMVLSLKTGGIGLNLTAANHVIHFDRWWNPAVENQATDRTFRIGQEKNVVVHKFITKGTIEEKIDTIIEQKIKLSNDIIPKMQEKWITEMNNEEILDLFKFLT